MGSRIRKTGNTSVFQITFVVKRVTRVGFLGVITVVYGVRF